MNQTVDLSGVLTVVEDAGLFVAACTIKEPPPATDVDGLGQHDLQLSDFTPVVGLIAIPCMCAPRSVARVQATEAKNQGFTLESSLFHVLLDGYFPQIEQKQVAFITGPPFDTETALEIDGVESSSQGVMTRLGCSEYSL